MFKTLRLAIICMLLIFFTKELGNTIRTVFDFQTKSHSELTLYSPADLGCTTDMECYQLTGVNY